MTGEILVRDTPTPSSRTDLARLEVTTGNVLRGTNSAGVDVPLRINAVQAAALAVDAVTTSATSTDTALQFSGVAGETYVFTFHVMGTSSTAAGMRFRVSAPGGSTMRSHISANTSSAGSYNTANRLDSINADTSSSYWLVAATACSFLLRGSITLGTNGTVRLGFRAATEGDTVTFLSGSNVNAVRTS